MVQIWRAVEKWGRSALKEVFPVCAVLRIHCGEISYGFLQHGELKSYIGVNSDFSEDNSQTCRWSRKSPRFMHLNDFSLVHAKITEVLL